MTPPRVQSTSSPLTEPRALISSMFADLRLAGPASWRLFVRGQQARHRQSLLGYVWLLVPATASTLVWLYLARRRILVTGQVGVSYAAYVMAGMLAFQAFVDALTGPLRRLHEARGVLAKTRLPHESWMLAGALDALFALALRSVLLAVVLVWTGTPINAAIALAPIGVAATVLLGLALGLLVAPLGLLRRDVPEILMLGCGFLFFLTPVIYQVPHHSLVRLNPLTPLLVTTRGWLLGGATEVVPFAAVAGGSLLVLLIGWVMYRIAQPHVIVFL